VAEEYCALKNAPGVDRTEVVPGVTAITCVFPVPYWVMFICEPIGKLTEASVGIDTVFGEPTFISINLFLSVKASV
jgi:hypothetical protein